MIWSCVCTKAVTAAVTAFVQTLEAATPKAITGERIDFISFGQGKGRERPREEQKTKESDIYILLISGKENWRTRGARDVKNCMGPANLFKSLDLPPPPKKE